MRVDVDQLDKAVDGFLEATLGPPDWNHVLGRICQASGAVGANILPVWGRTAGLPATESMGGVLEAYFDEEWNNRDFRNKGLPQFFAKGSMLEQDYATEDNFKNEGYYKMHAKFGLRWTAIVGFESDEDGMGFILHRSLADGAFSREEEIIFQRMRSRLTLSASIMRSFSRNKISGMAEAFDIADLGCIFFDRHSLVIRLNIAAERLLGNGLQLSQGHLRTWKTDEGEALRTAVMDAISGQLLLKSTGGQLLVSREGRRPLVVRVQRLTGMFSDIFSDASVIAIISDPDRRPKTTTKTLVNVFGLTQTEAKIAIAVGSGAGLREIADMHSVSYETVRSHVGSVLRKTGTSRQSDLVALLTTIR